mgnify:CR=1 FL=1
MDNLTIEKMDLEQALIIESETAEMASKHLLKNTDLFDFWQDLKERATKRADKLVLQSALEDVEKRGEL